MKYQVRIDEILWVDVPDGADADEVLDAAVENKLLDMQADIINGNARPYDAWLIETPSSIKDM